MVNAYSIAGTLLVVVALAGGWRAWWKQAQEAGFMDRALRLAGHVPPETDPERTDMLRPIERDNDLDYGRHSRGSMHQRSEPYHGHHHQRIGCLTVAALQARLGVAHAF